MKEKVVNFVIGHKQLLVKLGLISGVVVGSVVVGAIVLNRMSDPELLMDQITEEASSEASSGE